MPRDRVEVAVVVQDLGVLTDRDCGDHAVDHRAYGLAASATRSVDRGGVEVVIRVSRRIT